PNFEFSESFIAVNRQDPRHLVAASNQFNRDAQRLYASADGGQTWLAQDMNLGVFAGGVGFHSDPGVAWDSQQAAYASALGVPYGAGKVEVQVVRTSDGGTS